MNRKRAILILLATAIAVATVASSCGNNAKGSSPPTAPSTTAPPVPSTRTPAIQSVKRFPDEIDMLLSMQATVEAADMGVHFVRVGEPIVVGDGAGGTITAAVSERHVATDDLRPVPAAEAAAGQLVFFWHNLTFLGWDQAQESVRIAALRRGQPGEIVVSYQHRARGDARCCPSLPPAVVAYRWTSGRLQRKGVPPVVANPVRVIFAEPR